VRPWVAVALDHDHFAQHGYARLGCALDPDLVKDWARRALVRLREHPEELKDSVPPTDPADFSQLDPEDPATWRWRRATLTGARRARLSQVAPAVAAAAQSLLAPHRLATEQLSDYLIITFPARGLRRVPSPSPGRHTGRWHLDDPGTSMSLAGWHNALLLFVLYSDIAPGGGGPFVACDSPMRIARLLRDQPGVDLTDAAVVRRVVRSCATFREITGRAGDVFVAHPFLLHSPSTNRGATPRLLANPMLRTVAPLDFDTGTSALETITRGWIGR